MAFSQSTRHIDGVAGENLTIYRYGKYESVEGEIDQADTIGELPDGVVQETVLSGAEVGLAIFDGGVAKVEAGAAVALDAEVMTDASGRAITFAAATGTRYIIGKALQAAGAAGEIIAIKSEIRGRVVTP